MISVLFINVIRYLILFFSLIGFGFHFAQCALFTEYQRRTSIPGWISAGHWQYLAWYISLGFSLLCALAVCTHATCCKRGHILRGDKCLGIANVVSFTSTILGNTFIHTQEPWTNGIVEFKSPAKGFITFCNMLDQDHDVSYPLLFQRCLLIDGTYIAAVTLFLLWMLLVLCTIFMKLKRASLITRIPNTDSLVSEKRQSKALDSSYHPYSRKHSTSFEERYNADKPTYKYATPIAPHGEKVQLPASYDHVDSHILHTQQVNPPLSRHHPPSTIPGGWVEYTEPMAVSPYHHEDPYQSTWYPNRVV